MLAKSPRHPWQSYLISSVCLGLLAMASEVRSNEPTVAEPSANAKQREIVTNSIGMKLVLIPAGEFMMGAADGEYEATDIEKPQHRVRITQPFFMSVYEVTQNEYQQVMKENPSKFKEVPGHDTGRFPVDNVSVRVAREFCEKLSELPAEKAAGRSYALPTEAQWEYACRAGTTTPFSFGGVLNGDRANCNGVKYPYGTFEKGKYLARTTTVGSYAPNALGLYDMHGNVREWCADAFSYDYYSTSPTDDPRGPDPDSTSDRPLRGGDWYDDAWRSRSSSRLRGTTGLYTIGIRVVVLSAKASK